MHRILFVCLGNICRSPAAEAVFAARARAAGVLVAVDSAGTSGWHLGDPPCPPMIRAAGGGGCARLPARAGRLRRYCAQACSAAWPKLV